MTAGVVLLVDDDPKVLRLLEATLRLKDLEVIKAETAAEALGWLKNNRPALMISDTEMPDLDGFDLFRRIRGLSHLSDVPFIFLSARSEPEDIVRGLTLGADEYLRKPFAVDELLTRVLRVLAEKDPDSEPPPRAEFSGSLDRTALPDVLRVLADHGRTGLLHVDPAGVSASGFIQIDGGRATHAEFALLDGAAALFALLAHPEGRFAFDASERLDGQTITGPTLPLLMEGYRLLDEGLLRRVDPRRPEAAGTLRALLQEHARLPSGDDEASGEFGETVIMELGAGTMDLELDEDFLEQSIADEVIGTDTVEYAAAFDEDELAEIEQASIPTRRYAAPVRRISEPWASVPLRPLVPSQPSGREVAPTERLRAPVEPLAGRTLGQIMVVGDADPDESEGSLDGDEYGVALVDDTIAELDVNSLLDPNSSRGDGGDVMAFFEALKAAATDSLGVDAVQLGTRSGRVIASNIAEVTRRDTVAAFSAQAMQFASRDPDGTQFASLDAGDLHVLVVEVDHVRVLTMLFGRRPDPSHALRILRPHLEEYRGPR